MGGKRPVHGQNHQQVECRPDRLISIGERMIFGRFADMIAAR
jgi:hypothetical protein